MKSVYWLPCQCGRKLPAQTTQAGALVHCTCGAQLAVPTLKQMAHLESAAIERAGPGRRAEPAWGKRQARILLSAVVTFASISMLIYLEVTKPRPPQVDSLAPIQVWSLWQDLRHGPDRNLSHAERQLLDRLRMYRTAKIALFVGAAAGVLTMAIFYAIPTPRGPRSDTTGMPHADERCGAA